MGCRTFLSIRDLLRVGQNAAGQREGLAGRRQGDGTGNVEHFPGRLHGLNQRRENVLAGAVRLKRNGLLRRVRRKAGRHTPVDAHLHFCQVNGFRGESLVAGVALKLHRGREQARNDDGKNAVRAGDCGISHDSFPPYITSMEATVIFWTAPPSVYQKLITGVPRLPRTWAPGSKICR